MIIAGDPILAAKVVMNVVSILGFFFLDSIQYLQQKKLEIILQITLCKFPLII